MMAGQAKPFIVERYFPVTDSYEIVYYKDGAKQCAFRGKRDDRQSVFWLKLDVRYAYGTVPNVRRVYFDDCTWKI